MEFAIIRVLWNLYKNISSMGIVFHLINGNSISSHQLELYFISSVYMSSHHFYISSHQLYFISSYVILVISSYGIYLVTMSLNHLVTWIDGSKQKVKKNPISHLLNANLNINYPVLKLYFQVLIFHLINCSSSHHRYCSIGLR